MTQFSTIGLKGGVFNNMKITDFLNEGAQNARTARELKEILHLDARDISELVRNARLNGEFVCSRTQSNDTGRAGFYLPETVDEELHTIRQLKAREREIRRVRKALEKNMRTKYGA